MTYDRAIADAHVDGQSRGRKSWPHVLSPKGEGPNERIVNMQRLAKSVILRRRNAAMNLSSMLRERAAAGRPIRIGQIGAGKFGTMFLSQVRLTPGMHLVGPRRPDAGSAPGSGWSSVGWPKEQIDGEVDSAMR